MDERWSELENLIQSSNKDVKVLVKFSLSIAQKAKNFIPYPEAKVFIESAIQQGSELINCKYDVADELYSFLDNEENGFTVLQERETDAVIIAAWDCIIDAIAILCKYAYMERGDSYLPEPIELVDEDTIHHMIKSFLSCNGGDKEQICKLFYASTEMGKKNV